MAATNSMPAGIYNMWIAKRDSNGYPKGTVADPDAPGTNVTLGAYRAKYPISFTPAQPTYETATRRGGQAVRGQRDLGISSHGVGTLELDGYDEAWHALVSGSAVDVTTVTGWNITAPNTQKAKRPQLILGCSIGLTTEAGNDEFGTYIWNNVTLRPQYPRGSQSGGENPNPLSYELVPDVSPRTGLGILYSAMGLNVAENSDLWILIRDAYEIYLTTFIANGVATSFTLPFKPASSDATGAAENFIAKAGVITAVTSVNTSNGLVTLTGAGSTGDIWTFGTPTSWVPTS